MSVRETHVQLAVVVAISLLACIGDGLELGDLCATPNRARGSCIGIRNCPSLVAALKVKPLPQSTLDYLRRSQCGFYNYDPLVCCPSNPTPTPAPPSRPQHPPPGAIEVTEDVSRHWNLGILRNDLCGAISDDRIINGNRTKLNELPWMALIAYTVRSGSPFRCGGTIISDRYILTAAHCVKFLPSNLRPISVRLGEHDLESGIDCEEDIEFGYKTCAPKPQDISIEEIIPHPKYIGKSNLQNDIALIRLSRAADFTPDSVRPVCLPVGLSIQEQNVVGKKLIVAGWGVTENDTSSTVLLKVEVPVTTHELCASVYKAQVTISRKTQMCAGGVKSGGDSCSGDSGGPLTYFGQVQGSIRTIQHGIVSFGPRSCGSSGLPGVYTRVGYFMKWILDNMRR